MGRRTIIGNFAKRSSITAIAISILTLVACSQAPQSEISPAQSAAANNPAPPAQSNARRMAVSHSFTLRVPSTALDAVQQKHLAECRNLGCTVLNTRLERLNVGRISARTTARIAPSAYAAFLNVITAPPVEVVAHSETADDRTVAVVDVEKRLELKSTLRDRLTAMLRDPTAKSVAEPAALEKELAQVQGDIEAAIAQRDDLRTLTETVRIDIIYSSAVAGIDLYPVRRAIEGSGQTLIESVGYLVTFLAAVTPWLPLIAFIAWAIRRGVRRLRAKRVAAPPP